MNARKMDSRELGLVLAQQMLSVEDLHYGLWDDDLELSITNLSHAQQRYTDMIINELPETSHERPVRVLDIGCGTGHLLAQLVKQNYQVDGVVPSKHLASKVREKIAGLPGNSSQIFEGRFEDFPDRECSTLYDVALFSESYQYIPMEASFSKIERLLKPGGIVLISDFFRTEAEGDGYSGDKTFSGGHRLKDFYVALNSRPFSLLKNENITARVSPNLSLVNDLLMNKVSPAGKTVGIYMKSRYPILSWMAARVLNKKIKKLKAKYFTGKRSKETFERYKSYRVVKLRYTK